MNKIRQRGVVVVRDIVDDEQAIGWRKTLEEFVKVNPVGGKDFRRFGADYDADAHKRRLSSRRQTVLPVIVSWLSALIVWLHIISWAAGLSLKCKRGVI